MKISKQLMVATLVLHLFFPLPVIAQTDGMLNAFSDFQARDVDGRSCNVTDAAPALAQLVQASGMGISQTIPEILGETSSPYLCVRRLATFSLYKISTRPDAAALLSSESATLAKLLRDADLPTRRVSILAIYTLHPNGTSPFVPVLESFLSREDAVSTIGNAVAPVLMEAAPDDAEATSAVAQYMRRNDQTSETRDSLINSIGLLVARRIEIGAEIVNVLAAYADDPNEQTSVHAIQTLQQMGRDTVSTNQQVLTRLANDPARSPKVRAAAAEAIKLLH